MSNSDTASTSFEPAPPSLSEVIKDIMKKINYTEDACGEPIEKPVWTSHFVAAIYEHVKVSWDSKKLNDDIDFLKIVYEENDQVDDVIQTFSKLLEKSPSVVKKEIVEKWDEEYCELLGYKKGNDITTLSSFSEFLKNGCRPIYSVSISHKKLSAFIQDKMDSFFDLYNSGTGDDCSSWGCQRNGKTTSFKDVNFLLYTTAGGLDEIESEIKSSLAGLKSPFLNISKNAKVPFFKFFKYLPGTLQIRSGALKQFPGP